MTHLFNQNLENLMKKPKHNEGEHAVLSSYMKTQRNYKDSNIIVFDSIVWEKQYDEFMNTLNEAGIEEVIIEDKSTALMSFLTMFLNDGWNVSAISLQKEGLFQDKEIVNGLLLKR